MKKGCEPRDASRHPRWKRGTAPAASLSVKKCPKRPISRTSQLPWKHRLPLCLPPSLPAPATATAEHAASHDGAARRPPMDTCRAVPRRAAPLRRIKSREECAHPRSPAPGPRGGRPAWKRGSGGHEMRGRLGRGRAARPAPTWGPTGTPCLSLAPLGGQGGAGRGQAGGGASRRQGAVRAARRPPGPAPTCAARRGAAHGTSLLLRSAPLPPGSRRSLVCWARPAPPTLLPEGRARGGA